MKKSETIYVCQECGYESRGWLGKCPSCEQWNTFIEEAAQSFSKADKNISAINEQREIKAINLKDIKTKTKRDTPPE